MEIRQLLYFLEVAKQKNMTKAAEILHVSQPALSKMVKALEKELGMTLIIRSNKSSEVTDAGFIVMEYAKKMIALLDEMSTTLIFLIALRDSEKEINSKDSRSRPFSGFLLRSFKFFSAFPYKRIIGCGSGAKW